LKKNTKTQIDLRELARVGWRIISDSYFTDVCLQFPPQTIAAASLFLAAKITRFDFGGMQWWTTLDPEIRIEEIQGSTFSSFSCFHSFSSGLFFISSSLSRPSADCVRQVSEMYERCRQDPFLLEAIEFKQYFSPPTVSALDSVDDLSPPTDAPTSLFSPPANGSGSASKEPLGTFTLLPSSRSNKEKTDQMQERFHRRNRSPSRSRSRSRSPSRSRTPSRSRSRSHSSSRSRSHSRSSRSSSRSRSSTYSPLSRSSMSPISPRRGDSSRTSGGGGGSGRRKSTSGEGSHRKHHRHRSKSRSPSRHKYGSRQHNGQQQSAHKHYKQQPQQAG